MHRPETSEICLSYPMNLIVAYTNTLSFFMTIHADLIIIALQSKNWHGTARAEPRRLSLILVSRTASNEPIALDTPCADVLTSISP